MRKRYSEAFDRDWEFYLANRHTFTFCGEDMDVTLYAHHRSDKPVDAKRAFFLYDTLTKL